MKFSIIIATDSKNWIWKNNSLVWKIPSDMRYFKELTSNTKDLSKLNAVIMWRKTWESIPGKFRPLQDRINCILSTTLKSESINSQIDDFTLYFNSLEHCLNELSKKDNLENIFIIWWAVLYNSLLDSPLLDKIYLTRIEWDFDCDVFFDWVPIDFKKISNSEINEENNIKFSYEVWRNKKTKSHLI